MCTPRIPLVTPCIPPGRFYLQPAFVIYHCLMQWIFPIAARRGMGSLSGQEDSDGVLLKCFLSNTLPAFWAWGFLDWVGAFYFYLSSPGNSNSYAFYKKICFAKESNSSILSLGILEHYCFLFPCLRVEPMLHTRTSAFAHVKDWSLND